MIRWLATTLQLFEKLAQLRLKVYLIKAKFQALLWYFEADHEESVNVSVSLLDKEFSVEMGPRALSYELESPFRRAYCCKHGEITNFWRWSVVLALVIAQPTS